MKIGIYDSGIGGLSVLHRALKKMPEAEFIYYADTKHVPYGEKTREQIKGYVEEVLNFLIAKEVDAIVIACNTATSVATKEFRGEFAVPIVGMEPAVKRALKLYQDMQKRILVTATPVTIAGEKLHSLLEKVDTEHEVDLAPLPKLVRFAEAGRFQDPEVDEYLKNSLQSYTLNQYAAVVLGCTHFNYFKQSFRKIFPGEIHFVDGNEGTLRQLRRVFPEQTTPGEPSKVTYYFSGEPADDEGMKKIQACMTQLDKVYEIKKILISNKIHPIPILCNGDETQESWKPLLNTILALRGSSEWFAQLGMGWILFFSGGVTTYLIVLPVSRKYHYLSSLSNLYNTRQTQACFHLVS